MWVEAYAEERGDVPPSQESDLCYYLFHFLLQETIIGYTNICQCHICKPKEREVFLGLMSDIIAHFRAHNMNFVISVTQSLDPPIKTKSSSFRRCFRYLHQICYTVQFAGVRTSNLCITGATTVPPDLKCSNTPKRKLTVFISKSLSLDTPAGTRQMFLKI